MKSLRIVSLILTVAATLTLSSCRIAVVKTPAVIETTTASTASAAVETAQKTAEPINQDTKTIRLIIPTDENNVNSNDIQSQSFENADSNFFKLYLMNSNEIDLYSNIDVNNYLITRFSKTDWGTWNIHSWSVAGKDDGKILIPAENESLMAGPDTDWEYVLRASKSADSAFYFSGGNHSNEGLNDIEFVVYSQTNDENFKIGDIIDLKKLEVLENTSLNLEEYDILDYAAVQRKYTFEPNSIKLSTTFTFSKDIFLGTSYVTMFPVSKDFGRYFKFDNSGDIFQTGPPGFTKTIFGDDYYIGKTEALSAIIWGDMYPEYKFKVWVKDKEMLNNFNNDLKVFIWDLSVFENKLYYSKYDTEKPVAISAGSVWNNMQGWDFYVEN